MADLSSNLRALVSSLLAAQQPAALPADPFITNSALNNLYVGPLTANAVAQESEISGHINNLANPHAVTAAQVGLGNVNNTSDANKPISIAVQNALTKYIPTSGATGISLMDPMFGVVSGSDCTAAVSAAIDKAYAMGVTLFIPTGTYVMSSKITKTFAGQFRMDGAGQGAIFQWADGSNAGFDFTYSDITKPTVLANFALYVGTKGVGTALKVTSPFAASANCEGPVFRNIRTQGIDTVNNSWDKSFYLVNCWYPLFEGNSVKGDTYGIPPYVQSHAFYLDTVQAPAFRDNIIFHVDCGIRLVPTSGQANYNGVAFGGEGLSVIGGEMVGVMNGIIHTDSQTSSGTSISDTHINANYRCIVLTNRYQLSIHDCLLFKTQTGTYNWQAIELNGCKEIMIHGNNFSCPGVTTGGQDAITLNNSYFCEITHNRFSTWPSAGSAVILLNGSNWNTVRYNGRRDNETYPLMVAVLSSAGTFNRLTGNLPEAAGTFVTNQTTQNLGNRLSDTVITSNTSNTMITSFGIAGPGDIVRIYIADQYTGFVHNVNQIVLKGGANVNVGAAGLALTFLYDGTRWIEISRNA